MHYNVQILLLYTAAEKWKAIRVETFVVRQNLQNIVSLIAITISSHFNLNVGCKCFVLEMDFF